MDLKWLDDFVALADTHSFSRAAELRNVTQPAFSRRIKALEEWVGVDLFCRTPLGAELTPAGSAFGRDAGSIIRSLSQLRADARAAGGREAATLKFVATHV